MKKNTGDRRQEIGDRGLKLDPCPVCGNEPILKSGSQCISDGSFSPVYRDYFTYQCKGVPLDSDYHLTGYHHFESTDSSSKIKAKRNWNKLVQYFKNKLSKGDQQ
jgi:hypothetical protein